MTLNGYFMSNLVFMPAVYLGAFDFQSPPQKMNIPGGPKKVITLI